MLQFVIPMGFAYFAPKLGMAKAWDLPIRQERYLFLGITLISYLTSTILSALLGSLLLFHLNVIILLLAVITAAITLYWKISFHAVLVTAGSILTDFLFGWRLPLLYLSIPIIIWARYQLQSHTTSQLVGGFTIATVMTLGGLIYFGYT